MQTASNLTVRTATEAVLLTDSEPEAHGFVLTLPPFTETKVTLSQTGGGSTRST